MTKQSGGCHCGKVRYEVEIDLTQPVIECNCSHCQIKGLLLSFVPATQFTLLSGSDDMTEYHFNKKLITHPFCKHCGVQAFGRGTGKDGVATVAVNARSIDGIDISVLTRNAVNGKDY